MGAVVDQLLMLAGAFSLPVKAGWAIFLLWTVAQVMWYRRGRTELPQPLPPWQPERRTWTSRTTRGQEHTGFEQTPSGTSNESIYS